MSLQTSTKQNNPGKENTKESKQNYMLQSHRGKNEKKKIEHRV